MQQQEVLQHELLPFPSKPMVSDPASGKYYRCLVLRADHHQQQVLLQWEYVHNSSSFWLPLSSQRIWRGSYLAKVWNCCGEVRTSSITVDIVKDMAYPLLCGLLVPSYQSTISVAAMLLTCHSMFVT